MVGVLLAAMVGAVLLARHSSGNRAGLLYGTTAGALFGLVAVQIKSVTEQLHDPFHALTSFTTYLCAATIGAAVWCQQRAFAKGALDAAYPAMVVTEPIAAMVVSLAILGEKLSSHSVSTALSLIGVGVMVVGVLGLAKGAAVRIEETRPGLPRPGRAADPLRSTRRTSYPRLRQNESRRQVRRSANRWRASRPQAAAGRPRLGQRRTATPAASTWSGPAQEIFTNQPMPNRSWHMPNVAPQGAGASGICTVPPSDNRSQ